jgi:O-acetyl-ADP-ribose deacetylase (regulator of RNase III)
VIELVKGNLLEAKVEALVNTVNTEGVMGKGIALQFKKKFPAMFEAYQEACTAGEVKPGRVNVYERGEVANPRFIINFPTKRHWREASKMEDIESGLAALALEIQNRRIRSVAIPALGCGLGGLQWKEVYLKIESALKPLTDVRVLVFAPVER